MSCLWRAFDKDNSGSIERPELEEIVFHLIVIFWEYSSPKKKVPKRDQLQSVVDNISNNIMRDVDKDKDGLIKRNEFDDFGKYVMMQWQACVEKCKGKTCLNEEYMKTSKGSFNLHFNTPVLSSIKSNN